MSQLVAFAFKDQTGAEQMQVALGRLRASHLLTLSDAALVIRTEDGKVQVKQAVSLVGTGAPGDAFGSMLISLLPSIPWWDLAISATAGAPGEAFGDDGVHEEFMQEVGATIDPGGSALFLLVEDWIEDQVMEKLIEFDAQVLQTSLSEEEKAKLRAASIAGHLRER